MNELCVFVRINTDAHEFKACLNGKRICCNFFLSMAEFSILNVFASPKNDQVLIVCTGKIDASLTVRKRVAKFLSGLPVKIAPL